MAKSAPPHRLSLVLLLVSKNLAIPCTVPIDYSVYIEHLLHLGWKSNYALCTYIHIVTVNKGSLYHDHVNMSVICLLPLCFGNFSSSTCHASLGKFFLAG